MGLRPMQYKALHEAFDLECTLAFIEPDWDNPGITLSRIIDWHTMIALDPRVSSDARALIDSGSGLVSYNIWMEYKEYMYDQYDWNEQQLKETDGELNPFRPMYYEHEPITFLNGAV